MCTPQERERVICEVVTEMGDCAGPNDEPGTSLYARWFGCAATGVPARDATTLWGHLGGMGDECLALLLLQEGFPQQANVLRGTPPVTAAPIITRPTPVKTPRPTPIPEQSPELSPIPEQTRGTCVVS